MCLAALEPVVAASPAGGGGTPPDVIFATALLSAADLRASLPPGLCAVPLVLYMHENQATYPASDRPNAHAKCDVHFGLTNLTSALAADLMIFNSAWNRRSF